jgi:hypothetical protein
VYTNARWHADGLRWIASVFEGLADYLERAADTEAPYEKTPFALPNQGDPLEAVRQRIQSRIF